MTSKVFGETRKPPQGTILMWGQPLADIPSGWVLCDGNNGTPNLLNRFLRGAPSGSDPGGTGGTHSYTLSTAQLPSHSHSPNMYSNGTHDHIFATDDQGWNEDDNGIKPSGSGYGGATSTTNGDHTHSANSSTTGSDNAVDNRPAFHELAYIMKA